eukprot:3101323-Alexandrium_andersonii.AAC.1
MITFCSWGWWACPQDPGKILGALLVLKWESPAKRQSEQAATFENIDALWCRGALQRKFDK